MFYTVQHSFLYPFMAVQLSRSSKSLKIERFYVRSRII